MKRINVLVAVATACCLLACVAGAQPKSEPKAGPKVALNQTCCEKAFAEGKECRNKCCLTAHRQGKSCEKCNPGKQDLEVMKKLREKNLAKKPVVSTPAK